jgi:mannitol-1-phosphate/altronate dehydrogenase
MEKFADYFVYFVIIVVALALRYLYKENRKSKEKEDPEQQQLQQQLYSGPSIRDYANIMSNNTTDASDPDTNQETAADSEQNGSSEQTEVDHRD